MKTKKAMDIKEFTGWKGGEFTMDESTPVWVANAGNSGNTGLPMCKNWQHYCSIEKQKLTWYSSDYFITISLHIGKPNVVGS